MNATIPSAAVTCDSHVTVSPRTHEQLRDKKTLCCAFTPWSTVSHMTRHILHFRGVNTECIPAVSSHSRNSVLLAAATVQSTDTPPVWTSTHITVRGVLAKNVDDSQEARSQHRYSKMKVLFATLAVSITTHSVKLVQPQLTFGELMRPLVNNALCWARGTVRPVSQW